MRADIERYRVAPGSGVALDGFQTREGDPAAKADIKAATSVLQKKAAGLLDMLYARRKHAILVVLQAMDAAGKDSTIRRCFGPLNPQRVKTTAFRQPNRHERRHDFLWRIHQHAPARGTIGVFNRSHYEAVLIEKVKDLAPGDVLEKRYEHINDFEQMLVDEGTLVLKFYLHVSKAYQKKRLERRLRRPDKQWKFSRNDIPEREHWREYMDAYEVALGRCSTKNAPWYIVPSERRWYRDFVIVEALVQCLESLDLSYPQPELDVGSITIPD
ncbi:MAG: polyphosphate kinase 2 family protein [Chitinivibrionales bacterium]|nr:polyphosphate kinase 2 family protein [Chitinivibrionales bacterium]MBD3395301.1 polyphosphate kinase 2 family protein [Chitinivibrionales bacterium]